MLPDLSRATPAETAAETETTAEGITAIEQSASNSSAGDSRHQPEPDECGSRFLEYQDEYNLVYGSMVLAGIGFLLPYNSFVNAVDFYQQRFEGHMIMFDISMTYMGVMLISVVATNLLVTKIHLRWRITFGYLVSLVVIFLTTIFDVIMNAFPPRWSYSLTLFSTAVVSLGCTVQQSSFFGFASMLPERYAQAVMLGESCAGFIVSMNRLFTKKILASTGPSTALFFILSSCLLLLSLITFTLAVKSHFVRQFIQPTSPRTSQTAADQMRMLLETGGDGIVNPSFQAEVSDIPDGSSVGHSASSPASSVVEDSVTIQHPESPLEAALLNIEFGLQLRLQVACRIWRYMASIGLCYLVTLSLFPGIESEIPSCDLRDWNPLLLMAVFNCFDLVGKVLAAVPVPWRGSLLLMFSTIRFCLIPFFMAAASPRQRPHITGEGWACLLTASLGMSNGYFGSVPMILAPKTAPVEHREIAGNLMTLSYSVGLTAGSGIAYWLDDLLGPIPAKLTTWQYACGLYNVSQVIIGQR